MQINIYNKLLIISKNKVLVRKQKLQDWQERQYIRSKKEELEQKRKSGDFNHVAKI
jgi:hypothetical protein